MWIVSLSEQAQWSGPWGGSFIGDPERYVKKAPDRAISFHRDPFMAKGNLEPGRGLVHWGL